MADLTLDEKQDALRSVKFFEHCSPRQIHDLADLSQQRDLSVGDELCHEGDFDQQVFVLLEGEVSVTQHGDDVGTIGPGEVVGELAMLGDGHRTATLVATTPLRVLVMDPDFVDAVLAADPGSQEHLGPKAKRKPEAG
jgi:CRP-like cAMP-binding protein